MNKRNNVSIVICKGYSINVSVRPPVISFDRKLMGRMKGLLFVLLIISGIVLLSNNVFSLGVTPGRTTLDFSSNLAQDISFSVANTENKEMNVVFIVEGDLADFITLSSDIERFSADESSKEFSYGINLPRGLSPGLHEADIVIAEVPAGEIDAEIVIRASVSVVTQLHVYVPYHGKYVDVNFDIVNKEGSNLIDFYLPLISRGDKNIRSVKGIIKIYKDSELVGSLETNELSIGVDEKKELSVVWEPNVAPGKYRAVAEIVYDGNRKEIEKEFNVGSESLGVLGVSVNNFKLGDVARIKVLVQNKLSDAIKKATANLKVQNTDEGEVANLDSEDYEILGLKNKELVLYWDTEGLDKGEYNSELKIDFDDKFINKNFRIDVSDNSMKFVGVGFVVDSGAGGKVSTAKFLMMIVIFLVLINFAWIVWWLRHKKEK